MNQCRQHPQVNQTQLELLLSVMQVLQVLQVVLLLQVLQVRCLVAFPTPWFLSMK